MRGVRTLAVMLLITMAALLQGCLPRYTFNGASIDYNTYRTISFGDFPIRAALVFPPLQQLFENRMIDMIEQQTRLQVIDNVNSDLRMEGEITGYSLSPQAIGEDAYASQTRLTITVRIKYINNRKPELSKDQTFTAYRDFSSSEMLTDVQDQLCNEITKDLADLIFNATLGDW
ncbi:MAG: LptE family protein [Muribaculaceae bacterium]|nr:LptE family protein [Muribaculaceae bacterium]